MSPTVKVCYGLSSSETPNGLDNKVSELDRFIEQYENHNEFESFAESAELSALDEFEVLPIEFEPYDTEGMTTYGEAN